MKNQPFVCGHQLIVLSLVMLLVMALLLNCSSSGANRRGKLSDAVGKASDKHQGDRKTETKPDPTPETGESTVLLPDSVATATGEEAEEASLAGEDTSPNSDISSSWWTTLSFGKALTTQEGFAGLNQFNLTFGNYLSWRWRGEVVLGGGWAPVEESSELRNSLKKNVVILSFGLGAKYYLTRQHTFLGNYLLGGLNFSFMFWEYKNAITADVYDDYGNVTGTEEIHSDNIGGLDIYLGIGFNLAQSSRFQLGLEAVPGILLWDDKTRQGFDNDVFKPAAYAKLKLVINFRN